MRRTVHPHLHRLLGGEVGRGPDEILSDRPVAATTRRIEDLDPLPENRPVGRLVREVSVRRHRARVTGRRPGERGRPRQRLQAILSANTVHFEHYLGVQPRNGGHSGAGRSGIRYRNSEQAKQNRADGAGRNSSLSLEHHERKIGPVASLSYPPKWVKVRSIRGFLREPGEPRLSRPGWPAPAFS